MSRILFLFITVIAISLQWFYSSRLPEKVASHFNASGAANDWMSNTSNALVASIMLLFVYLMFIAITILINRLPASLINLPNKDYWLSEENKQTTFNKINSYMASLGVLTNIFLVFVFHLAYHANMSQVVQLNNTHLLIGLAIFFALFTVSTIKFVIKFKQAPN